MQAPMCNEPTFTSSSPVQSSYSSIYDTDVPAQLGGEGPLRRSLQERREIMYTSREGVAKSADRGRPVQRCSLNLSDLRPSSAEETRATTIQPGQVQFRGWEEYQPITSLPAERNSVRIMSYNILAARYTTTDKYPHCPIAALSEAFRMTNIFQEVNNMQPDILVLQELSGEMFATGLGQRLREEAGYGGYHVPITSRGHEPCSARPEHEGVGIFFRASRFTALREIPISFNELAARDATLDQQFRTQLMLSSHNVASIVALKDHHTKAVVVVGGIHAYYDWTKPLCQLWQMRQLILAMQAVKASLENAGEAKVRVILCGDCNAEAQSLAIQYVLINRTKLAAPSTTANGSAGSFHSRPLCPTEEWTKSTLLSFDPHTLHLASAYEQYFAANEDHVTSIGGGFHGVIDYIFYDFDEWEPASVANVSNADVDIPNLSVPSDHFPLCATLIPKR